MRRMIGGARHVSEGSDFLCATRRFDRPGAPGMKKALLASPQSEQGLRVVRRQMPIEPLNCGVDQLLPVNHVSRWPA